MANVKISFYGSNKSETKEHTLEVFANNRDEIFISIDMHMPHEFGEAYICLDKETAIKFSRELRKHISYLE